MLPDGTPEPVALARRAADAHRRRRAVSSRGADLAYALTPNGRTLDYEVASPTADLAPFGVAKQSFVTGLYASGQATGYYAAAGRRPRRRTSRTWFARINAGEPYGAPAARASPTSSPPLPLVLLPSTTPARPAPLLISNGWTDDLFPVDEALRFYNRTRAQYPGAPLALMFLDFGHARARTRPPTARASRSAPRVDGPLRQGRRERTRAPGRRGADPDVPGDGALRRAAARADVGGAAPRRGALHRAAAQTVALGRRRPGRRARRSTRSPAAARARRRRDATSPGTASYRLPAATGAATRCWARRRSSRT